MAINILTGHGAPCAPSLLRLARAAQASQAAPSCRGGSDNYNLGDNYN